VQYIISDNLGVVATNWLKIADKSKKGIFDDDCLTLAKLHSDAVDYPKTGTPVPMEKVPSVKAPFPDWSKPEVLNKEERSNYYKSDKALGVLYRDIQLFDPVSNRRTRRSRTYDNFNGTDGDKEGDDSLGKEYGMAGMDKDAVYQAVISRVERYIRKEDSQYSQSKEMHKNVAEGIFVSFASHLEQICASHTLSNKYERLSEAEAILGVITERTTATRRRLELMAKLRERTSQLVTDVLWELQLGEQSGDGSDRLCLALAAWELSYDKIAGKEFGGWSFWWVCLGAVFRAMEGDEDGM